MADFNNLVFYINEHQTMMTGYTPSELKLYIRLSYRQSLYNMVDGQGNSITYENVETNLIPHSFRIEKDSTPADWSDGDIDGETIFNWTNFVESDMEKVLGNNNFDVGLYHIPIRIYCRVKFFDTDIDDYVYRDAKTFANSESQPVFFTNPYWYYGLKNNYVYFKGADGYAVYFHKPAPFGYEPELLKHSENDVTIGNKNPATFLYNMNNIMFMTTIEYYRFKINQLEATMGLKDSTGLTTWADSNQVDGVDVQVNTLGCSIGNDWIYENIKEQIFSLYENKSVPAFTDSDLSSYSMNLLYEQKYTSAWTWSNNVIKCYPFFKKKTGQVGAGEVQDGTYANGLPEGSYYGVQRWSYIKELRDALENIITTYYTDSLGTNKEFLRWFIGDTSRSFNDSLATELTQDNFLSGRGVERGRSFILNDNDYDEHYGIRIGLTYTVNYTSPPDPVVQSISVSDVEVLVDDDYYVVQGRKPPFITDELVGGKLIIGLNDTFSDYDEYIVGGGVGTWNKIGKYTISGNDGYRIESTELQNKIQQILSDFTSYNIGDVIIYPSYDGGSGIDGRCYAIDTLDIDKTTFTNCEKYFGWTDWNYIPSDFDSNYYKNDGRLFNYNPDDATDISSDAAHFWELKSNMGDLVDITSKVPNKIEITTDNCNFFPGYRWIWFEEIERVIQMISKSKVPIFVDLDNKQFLDVELKPFTIPGFTFNSTSGSVTSLVGGVNYSHEFTTLTQTGASGSRFHLIYSFNTDLEDNKEVESTSLSLASGCVMSAVPGWGLTNFGIFKPYLWNGTAPYTYSGDFYNWF